MKYQDYYETLDLDRTASQDDITKAYRKLARKFHPDVNKDTGAEDRFKEINEAHEVLKDPETRKRYDALGANWKSGQDFRPPPGFENLFGGGKPGGFSFQFGEETNSGFSDFFDAVFGGMPGAGPTPPRKGQDFKSRINIGLREAFSGTKKSMSFNFGNGERKTYQVRIPPGTTDGSKIRLAGQGSRGMMGGPQGDLLLEVKIGPDPQFKLEGDDIVFTLTLAPWEAALGEKVEIETLDGKVAMTIPPGSQGGQRLRLKGKGFPKKHPRGSKGDFFVELRIAIPTNLSEQEKSLFEELKNKSNFQPRGS